MERGVLGQPGYSKTHTVGGMTVFGEAGNEKDRLGGLDH
jgi:hypothetical protein